MWELLNSMYKVFDKDRDPGITDYSVLESTMTQYVLFGNLFEKWYHVSYWID
jgi:hypothetical protein